MTSLPIQVAVAMLLGVLVASNYQQLIETASGKMFTVMLSAHALSMIFIGLRWSLDAIELMRIAATLAVISVVLLYLAFSSLGRLPVFESARDWPHLIPPFSVVAIALIDPAWIDAALVLIKTVYVALLIFLARKTPVSLQLTRLNWLNNSEKALWGAALMFIDQRCNGYCHCRGLCLLRRKPRRLDGGYCQRLECISTWLGSGDGQARIRK